MSTRCRISVVNENGKVRSIYCHHDGYLEYVGEKLVEFYDNEKVVNQLLDLGDLSALGNSPVSDKEYWKNRGQFYDYSEEFCLAYRDRGEDDVDAKEFASFDEFKNVFPEIQEEYNYVFKDGKWYYCEDDWNGDTIEDLRPVEEEL